MKNNNFAEEFNREQEIKAAFQAASDEAGKEKARAEMQEFRQGIIDKGEEYGTVYRFYSAAREVGNEYIDISDCYEYKDEKKLVETLKTYGIEAFTFSSGWSSAVDSAWLFLQNGCTLDGMVELNTQHKDWENGGYEKTHGYLFRIQ